MGNLKCGRCKAIYHTRTMSFLFLHFIFFSVRRFTFIPTYFILRFQLAYLSFFSCFLSGCIYVSNANNVAVLPWPFQTVIFGQECINHVRTILYFRRGLKKPQKKNSSIRLVVDVLQLHVTTTHCRLWWWFVILKCTDMSLMFFMQILFKFQVNLMKIEDFRNSTQVVDLWPMLTFQTWLTIK